MDKWQVQVISPVCCVKNNHIIKLRYEKIVLLSAQKILLSVPALSTLLAKKKIWIGLDFFLKIFDDRNKLMANVISMLTSKINNLLWAHFFTAFSLANCIHNAGNI